MSNETTDRTLEYTLDLAASPEEVWKAIATGEGLAGWFAYDAKVTPGEGGSVWLSWGDWDGEAPITIWKPNQHLQTNENRAPFGGEGIPPVDITVNYFIEARAGGTTRLRLVHAGMGPEKEWDGEYHATAADWPWFLVNLEHYIVARRGAARRVINLVGRFERSVATLWDDMLGESNASGPLEVGASYERTLCGTRATRGEVKLLNPGKRFIGTVDDLDRAMVVMTFHDKGEESTVVIELSTYDFDDARFAKTKDAWSGMLRDLGGSVDEEPTDG